MSGGQHEPVPPEPPRVGGVVPHDALEQCVGDGREAHRRAGVSAPALLDRVRGQDAGGVDRALVHIGPVPGDSPGGQPNDLVSGFMW
jgi:hypothetical protein